MKCTLTKSANDTTNIVTDEKELGKNSTLAEEERCELTNRFFLSLEALLGSSSK